MLDFGFYNMDCMEGMKEFPDKYFDLAIVDPPYGDAMGGVANRFGERFERYSKASKYGTKIAEWDIAPKQEYFDELYRVSKNQIIWGANYFNMPPTRCFVIWEKTNIPQDFTMSMCEYAWTSFNDNAKVYKHSSLRDDTSGKFHPTEKPIDLYKWLLTKYAKEGDKILDTHVGSASSLIAFHDSGFDYVGFEIDESYYEKASKRLEIHTSQIQFDWRSP